MTVALEYTAHEDLHSLTLNVKNDRKWNVDIAEEVDVVCVCNVVDDERTRYELFIVSVITVSVMRMLFVSVFRVRFVIVDFLAMVAIVVVVRIAMFSAVSVGIVLGMLGVCVVLISVAVVLSQERCSREEEQGGKQGLE